MLYVFTGVNQLPDSFIDTCSTFLPKWRQARMMEFRFSTDQKLNALAYLLLVYALRKEGFFTGLPEFGYQANGKPFLTNYPDLHFNLSHCPNTVVCLLSDQEVGVDVEQAGDYDDDLAREISNDQEYKWITESADPHQQALRFTELWTRKESVVKWMGSGLDNNLRDLLTDNSSNGFDLTTSYNPEGNFYISTCTNKRKPIP